MSDDFISVRDRDQSLLLKSQAERGQLPGESRLVRLLVKAWAYRSMNSNRSPDDLICQFS